MSKYFYRDVKLAAKFCKKCKVEYRPRKGSFFAALGLCWNCRKAYYKVWYKTSWKSWLAKLSPEDKIKYKNAARANWKAWVMRNGVRRRQQALASYHRHKAKHKGRKHRA